MPSLYYFQGERPNFGDELNPFLLPGLFPGLFDDDRGPTVFGIGTVLNDAIPATGLKVVFGSGYGYGAPPRIDELWRIYAVRGPITARVLGLDPALAICDPAVLVRTLPAAPPRRDLPAGYMPHFESLGLGRWREVCELAGVTFIDPTAPIMEVLDTLRRCRLVITEAMHGAIVADALRTPWVAVEPLLKMHSAKWNDWAQSLDIALRAEPLPPSSFREGLRARYRAFRSRAGKLRTQPAGQGAAPSATAAVVPGEPRSKAILRLFVEQPATRIGDVLLTPKIEARLDRPLMDRAAAALQDLSRREGSLSEEGRLEEAVERLLAARDRLMADSAKGFPPAGATSP